MPGFIVVGGMLCKSDKPSIIIIIIIVMAFCAQYVRISGLGLTRCLGPGSFDYFY